MKSPKKALREIIITQAILHGHITRNEIAALTDTRLATIGEAIRSLLDEGMIEEPERQDGVRTGRRASPLCIHGARGCFLGIALSPHHIQIVLTDAAGTPVIPASSFTVDTSDPEAVSQRILDSLSVVRKQAGEPLWKTVLAAGFADPGLVDEKCGASIKAVNLPGWEDINTAQRLEKSLECPVHVRPEMAARAYAERLTEEIPDNCGCFHLNLGDGVGGAYTRGLDIFTGDSFCQMEIGHIIVEENGALCQCGNHGCLEALVGTDGLTNRVDQLRQKAVDSTLIHHEFSSARFVQSVRAGDKVAARLAIETAQQIGKALAAVTALLNPACISLSGPLFSLQEMILPVLQQTLTLRCLPQAITNLNWRVSRLDDEAPALGAALIARHRSLLQLAEQQ